MGSVLECFFSIGISTLELVYETVMRVDDKFFFFCFWEGKRKGRFFEA